MVEPGSDRWRAHPVLGALVRILVVLVPLAVSVLASIVVMALLPVPGSTAGRVLWWVVVLAVSWGVALLVDRVARRALPLAVLLELSLVFPDRAPSRLRMMRATSVRELERQLTGLRAMGDQGSALEVAETLVTLVGVLGLHDPRTRGHSERVRAYVDLLTDELQLPEDDRARLRWAALIHDLGKLTVPREILNGGANLPTEAWKQLHRHPDEGARLAAGLLPWLGPWGDTVQQHHERWNGNGYPSGLAGEQISHGARIVAVADAFEVMTANRSYSRAVSPAAARSELARCAGSQFDPAVVRAFLQISIGRLRWVLGPLSWLAVLPFTARLGNALRAGVSATAVIASVATGVVAGPGDRLRDDTSPAATTIGVPSPSERPGTDGTSGPTALGTASATSSASGTASPSASARPSSPPTVRTSAPTTSTPPPTARARTYFLEPGRLTAARPSGEPPNTVRLTAGGAGRSFDLLVGTTRTTVSASPLVVLYAQVLGAGGRDNALGIATVTLSDCRSTTGPCRTISTSQFPVGTGQQAARYEREEAPLDNSAAVLQPGHVLRMTVALLTQGNARSMVLAFGAPSTPSQLDLGR